MVTCTSPSWSLELDGMHCTNGLGHILVTRRGEGDLRMPPLTYGWRWSWWCSLGHSGCGVGERVIRGGARLRSNGLRHAGGQGCRYQYGWGSGSDKDGGGADLRYCSRFAISLDCCNSCPIDHHASTHLASCGSTASLGKIPWTSSSNPQGYMILHFGGCLTGTWTKRSSHVRKKFWVKIMGESRLWIPNCHNLLVT